MQLRVGGNVRTEMCPCTNRSRNKECAVKIFWSKHIFIWLTKEFALDSFDNDFLIYLTIRQTVGLTGRYNGEWKSEDISNNRCGGWVLYYRSCQPSSTLFHLERPFQSTGNVFSVNRTSDHEIFRTSADTKARVCAWMTFKSRLNEFQNSRGVSSYADMLKRTVSREHMNFDLYSLKVTHGVQLKRSIYIQSATIRTIQCESCQNRKSVKNTTWWIDRLMDE